MAVLVAPGELDDLREEAEGWKERALVAEAEAAVMLNERAQAQRGEERALLLLKAAEQRRRDAKRPFHKRPGRRLKRYRPPWV